jgi:hypothetical protein
VLQCGSPANPSPTPYAALNTVLASFVERVRDLTADNFVGAYLQGSFALGDFDENSDADFLIVVKRDIADSDVPALNALHAAIHDFPPPWGHRLEGSYSPAAILRRWSENPRDPPGAPPRPPTWADPGTSGSPPRVYPFLFFDHGARTVVRSEHDNTQVARWVTRERGIVLAGPDPRELIDEVSGEALRIERREKLHRAAVEGPPDPAAIDSRWLQAFLVVLYCRMLHTLETGTVVSKKAASQWALAKLDARWQRLIASSVRFEAEVFSPEPADPDAVALAKAVKCSWCGNDRVPKGSYHASLSSPLRSQG